MPVEVLLLTVLVPLSVPAPVDAAQVVEGQMASVMLPPAHGEEVTHRTALPPASNTCTAGCGLKAAAPVEAPGCVVNDSWVADPTEMVKALLVAAVSTVVPSVSVACS